MTYLYGYEEVNVMNYYSLVFVFGLSVSVLSINMHISEAQNATYNVSDAATNLTAAAQNATYNVSDAATNLTAAAQNATYNASEIAIKINESANEALTGLGQGLAAFVKGLNTSIQSENSSDSIPGMLNNTGNLLTPN